MHDWSKILLSPDAPLSEAIRVLGQESLRIALVVDKSRRLLGTITDGDIRRALINHTNMDTPVGVIMFTEPTTASIDDNREVILAMMEKRDILQVPILDSQKRVVGLETLQQLLKPNRLDNTVFLMAGGFGTRLRPLTNHTPKPLLKVGTKPILETILLQFIEAGFHTFYISTHYMADQVVEYFADGQKWGVEISYVYENEPLGTAGALGLLPEEVVQKPIVVMNGDLLTKINLRQLLEFHMVQNCMATMCVREYDFQVPYGVVKQVDNIVSGITEKPVHKFFINAGIYILEPALVKSVGKGRYLDMPTLLEENIEQGEKVTAFPVYEDWLDVGRLEEYERANREVLE